MRKPVQNIEEYRWKLMNYFLQIDASVNETELSELVNQFSIDTFDKKDVILKAGQFSDMVYYVVKGLVRIYYVKEEKEITNWFIKENMVFAPTYSIYTGKRNYANYEALEDTIVLKINYSTLESYYTKYHSLEHMGRMLIQQYYALFIKKTYDVLSLSSDERYQLFLKEHSELINRIPLRYIASYLGITPETLSRLRAKY
jgi:CRP-like cAMP-binding protein